MAAAMLAGHATRAEEPLGTAFTYQGRLRLAGGPASGDYGFEFSLWDAATGGTQVCTTQSVAAQPVRNGLFTVELDFGPTAFTGEARWLEIAVQGPGGGGYTTLSPRQKLAATPHALYALVAAYARTADWTALLGMPAGFADGIDNDTTYTAGTGLSLAGTTLSLAAPYQDGSAYDGRFVNEGQALSIATGMLQDDAVTAAKIAPAILSSLDGVSNDGGNIDLVAGPGIAITPDDTANTITIEATGGVAPYWSLGGNAGTNPAVEYLGTKDAVALWIRVNGIHAMRFEPGLPPNVVGGYFGNTVAGGVVGAAVGGGGQSGAPHSVTGDFATVSGGRGNTASSHDASIGGGDHNTASGAYATIAGGEANTAGGDWATVGGGDANVPSGRYATISGGRFNAASGEFATVSGGNANHAGDVFGTVGGGEQNAAGTLATVGGGLDNSASGVCAVIGGGDTNSAAHYAATVGGGFFNVASGEFATVGGGYYNRAAATFATIAGGGPSDRQQDDATRNQVYDDYGTIGGGGNNQAGSADGDTTNAPFATVAGGRRNSASDTGATVAGGVHCTASGIGATVSGGDVNTASGSLATVGGGRLNEASDFYATVGGGMRNTASGQYATIAGGGPSDPAEPDTTRNRVHDDYGTIGGGGGNQAGTADADTTNARFATVGGGSGNEASFGFATVAGGIGNKARGSAATVGGGFSNGATGYAATVGGGFQSWATGDFATAGGGYDNTATGGAASVGGGEANTADGDWATVGGGDGNTASGLCATVPGGVDNTASGLYATVPGGYWNEAVGAHSFAAGHRAKANHAGAFVWSDSHTMTDFESQRDHQFRVRAYGGSRFEDGSSLWVEFSYLTTKVIDTSTGAYLSLTGQWTNASDANRKENFAPVDARDVLRRVVALPVTTWNHKAEDPSIRHLGAMAQDFHAAFGLGSDDKTIGTLDADGVALAAIQGLHSLVREKDAQLADLAARLDQKDGEIAGLTERLQKLEALVAQLAAQKAGEAGLRPNVHGQPAPLAAK